MIAFARIDERLFHGQIAVKWVSQIKATDVIVIDDETADSPILVKMFTNLTPKGVRMSVIHREEAAAFLQREEIISPECRAFLLAKTPGVFLDLLEGGVKFSSLNVGNMFIKDGRKKFRSYFYANEEEIAQLKKIMEYGVECYSQAIPDGGIGNGRVPLEKLFNEKKSFRLFNK